MVEKIPAMVDMAMDTEEKQEMLSYSPADLPKYPYGLSISLCERELDKLGIEPDDVEVGDMLHMHTLAKVTSKSCNESENGSTCRVELQICYISAESEDDENEEEEKSEGKISRLYR